jgi:hypothetical protein
MASCDAGKGQEMGSERSQPVESYVQQREKWPGIAGSGQTFPGDRLCERQLHLPTEWERQIKARYESHKALIGGLLIESMAA